MLLNNEQKRLEEDRNGSAVWKKRGPCLSERQWGTVREDYSAEGDRLELFFPWRQRRRARRKPSDRLDRAYGQDDSTLWVAGFRAVPGCRQEGRVCFGRQGRGT